MTLQEKIDKLPLSIEYDERTYILRFGGRQEFIFIEYCNVNRFGNYHNIVYTENGNTDMALSQRLEDVVDRALEVIENKEWEYTR
jgi:hypothetical protein